MSKAISRHFVHFVWATRARRALIREEHDEVIREAIAIQCVRLGGGIVAVGADDDHVHVLASLARSVSVSELVGAMKGASSALFNRRFPLLELRWQRGYAHISVSPWDVTRVTEYVRRQRENHRLRREVSILEVDSRDPAL